MRRTLTVSLAALQTTKTSMWTTLYPQELYAASPTTNHGSKGEQEQEQKKEMKTVQRELRWKLREGKQLDRRKIEEHLQQRNISGV